MPTGYQIIDQLTPHYHTPAQFIRVILVYLGGMKE
jgi:hypothetical protein